MYIYLRDIIVTTAGDKIMRDVISCSENPVNNTVNSTTNFNVLEI